MARAAGQAVPAVPVMERAKAAPNRKEPRKLAGPYGASFDGSGARGLTFERRWTRPDIHPYDEITWEYRTAAIASETGKTVFEQKDVEVPSFWSQLATNVVVSKYFRGHIGSPEREHSVRQLIDRVVTTIAAWAETQRYFATDDDLAAFRAELTHLLVHQKMAFNSPVWFNVGIEPKPQCSACQPYRALVSTPDGMIPIGQLVEEAAVGREVYDANGVTRIVAVKNNGTKPVQRVHLGNGNFVEATPDHVVKAIREGRTTPEWLRVDELEVGMRMHLHPHRARVGARALVPAGAEAVAQAPAGELSEFEPVDRESAVLTAEAALAGWLQADGFVGQYESGTNRELTIEFQVANDDEYQWVRENLDVALPHVDVKVRDAQTKKTPVRRIRVHGEVVRDFVERWELLKRGPDIRVPDRLWTTSSDQVCAYLRSIFQADGYMTIRRESEQESARVGFAVIGERWTEDVQLLLNSIGIYSRRTYKREKRTDRYDMHEVAIAVGSERARYAELVGFIGREKRARLLESLGLRDLKTIPNVREEAIVAIENLGVEEVYDIQTESGEYLSNNVAVHNCFINSVQDNMGSIMDLAKTEAMLFKFGSGAGSNLSTIRSSREKMSGGGIPSGPVSFMRGYDAFAGVIRSGGKTRRAAKMVILDADHPDVLDFIDSKMLEEKKAWALIEQGYDPSFTGEAYGSVFFQNANHSVRVTDDFMRTVEEDGDWTTHAITTGEPLGTYRARDIFRRMADAAHVCGDPGIQYDTVINDWHTSANTDRIYASNPCCFVGETLIDTAAGRIEFRELEALDRSGVDLPSVYSFDIESRRTVLRRINKVWVAGQASHLVEVRTERGRVLRCTPEHRWLTWSGTYVQAQDLEPGMRLRKVVLEDAVSVEPAPATLSNDRVASVTRIELSEPVTVYDMEVDGTHNFGVADSQDPEARSIVVSNSEYMFLNDTACNLCSLNLMKFVREDGEFDAEDYRYAARLTITAQEILVDNASYPTPRIEENSHRFRPLGLGYANLGALLMSRGLAYDSDEGRNFAAGLTAIMHGEAYRQSAVIARDHGGPFIEYRKNEKPFLRVIAKHRDAAYLIPEEGVPADVLQASRLVFDEALELGREFGYRNAQVTVLAPTGCLVGDSLVMTDRGLVRLKGLGNPDGEQWQELDLHVATDDGPRPATKFFVNGAEPVVSVETSRGYRIQGTTTHRIRIVDSAGDWQWRRFADLRAGDRVPLMLGGMIGEPRDVALPPLPEAYWTSDHRAFVPRSMTADLAELVGYFMGDGSLHSRGLRFCVTAGDDDVVARIVDLGRRLFGLDAAVAARQGYTEVALHSVRLTLWWEACGFAKHAPTGEHRGKGYEPHVPDAVLYSNDPAAYRAFVRGLFEADGSVNNGYASFSTVSERFSREVQTLLLALGFATTLKTDVPGRGHKGANPIHVLRLLNATSGGRFLSEISFISERKREKLAFVNHPQAARYDLVPVSRETVDRLAPDHDHLRRTMLLSLSRTGLVSRRSATALLERTADPELAENLGYFYDEIASAKLGEEQLTYDISVPSNVTYVANGFVSHNTIAFMMDCDTTGIEPDIALIKYKKLVGEGFIKIVNQTVPAALRKLGYSADEVQAILDYVNERETIEGAPSLKPEHLPVFDCAFKPVNGERSIHYMGHVRMMGAVQPFLSGAISKTVNMPEAATADEIEQVYLEGWKRGLKAIAIYRDGSKRSQPLSTGKKKDEGTALSEADAAVVEQLKKQLAAAQAEAALPHRRRLPAERTAVTHKFDIAGHEGYITVGLYPDGQPGEIFLKMAKEGSTVSGLMDTFATAISLSLQYGVPMRDLVNKFAHVRFEPSGFTGNNEIPIAKSIIDYIFRWLGSRFLSTDDKANLGLIDRSAIVEAPPEPLSTDSGPIASGAASPAPAGTAHPLGNPAPAPDDASPKPEAKATDVAVIATAERANGQAGNGNGKSVAANGGGITLNLGGTKVAFAAQADAPSCMDCGSIMVRNGSCYKCLNCGSTSGCS